MKNFMTVALVGVASLFAVEAKTPQGDEIDQRIFDLRRISVTYGTGLSNNPDFHDWIMENS